MKKKLLLFAVAAFSTVVLLSWGVTGHRTIGKIAENHLSSEAKAAVKELLDSQTLADVATWADEARMTPEYKHTEPWHYINLPLGLTYSDFQKTVEGISKANVYSAMLKEEAILRDKNASKEQKAEALKFVVHFVGDLHQPMHISREEDKGGNTIQLNYEGKGANLHSVWDSKLIDHQGLSYEQMAGKYDHASAAQVKTWQSDPLIKWIWESYEISSKLYAEVDAMKSRAIDDSYYQEHIGIIEQRIDQAGIRLAGVLNEIFKNGLVTGAGVANGSAAIGGSAAPAPGTKPVVVDIHDAGKHLDENVRTCGSVAGYKVLGGMTLLNLGAAYPNQLLTVVLKDAAKGAYEGLEGQTICVTGKLIDYNGKSEIIVTDPKMIEKQ